MTDVQRQPEMPWHAIKSQLDAAGGLVTAAARLLESIQGVNYEQHPPTELRSMLQFADPDTLTSAALAVMPTSYKEEDRKCAVESIAAAAGFDTQNPSNEVEEAIWQACLRVEEAYNARSNISDMLWFRFGLALGAIWEHDMKQIGGCHESAADQAQRAAAVAGLSMEQDWPVHYEED